MEVRGGARLLHLAVLLSLLGGRSPLAKYVRGVVSTQEVSRGRAVLLRRFELVAAPLETRPQVCVAAPARNAPSLSGCLGYSRPAFSCPLASVC